VSDFAYLVNKNAFLFASILKLTNKVSVYGRVLGMFYHMSFDFSGNLRGFGGNVGELLAGGSP